jgi:hypothetical protein
VTEFRALLAAADLRDPWDAGAYLDVAPHLVTFWRDYAPDQVPAWAVMALRARVADLVGPPPSKEQP